MSKVTDTSYGSLGAPVAADWAVAVQASGPAVKRLLMSDAQGFVLNPFGGGSEISITSASNALRHRRRSRFAIAINPTHNITNYPQNNFENLYFCKINLL